MTKACFRVTPLILLFCGAGGFAQTATREWLTWGYDAERTGWNRGETALSKDNVANLQLAWSTQLSTPPKEVVLSTLTAPLVTEGVSTPEGKKTLVFVVGSDDSVFALDAGTGKVIWQRTLPNTLTPRQPATWMCSNSQNATPVIDRSKGVLYLNTSDGKLRGLSLSNGEDQIPPTDFVAPFARNWSLNLIEDVIYSPSGRGCGGTPAGVSAMDVSQPAQPRLSRLYTSGGRPAGAWGLGGVVKGPKGIYLQTADGASDPASGMFGQTVLAVARKEMRVVDSFTPPNWQYLNSRDLDLGTASPVTFPFQSRVLVAAAGKEGVLYLLDANALGGGPMSHSKPLFQSARLGNDEELLGGRGVWGAMATYADGQGRRFLYVPVWGPPSRNAPSFPHSYGDVPNGSVMAFEVLANDEKPSLSPVLISRDLHVPGPPVVANGVVYAIQTGENTVQNPERGDVAMAAGRGQAGDRSAAPSAAGGDLGAAAVQAAKWRSTPVSNLVLFAFDAQTGKQLYSSGKLIPSWVHFNEPVVAAGRVFLVSWDAHVYSFGLTPRQQGSR